MLAVLDRGETQLDAGGGIAGRLDDDVDVGILDQRHRVVGDVRRARLESIAKRLRLRLFGGPAHFGHALARAIGIEIGEADEVHAGGEACLCEVHGAEFAGADLADAHGFALRGALLEHVRQIHDASSPSYAAVGRSIARRFDARDGLGGLCPIAATARPAGRC